MSTSQVLRSGGTDHLLDYIIASEEFSRDFDDDGVHLTGVFFGFSLVFSSFLCGIVYKDFISSKIG